MTPMIPRKISQRVQGSPAVDGAGVQLVRVLGHQTVEAYDPFLMLDSFDSDDYDAYKAGFPMHPHRGIETISYVFKGAMTHHDSLGNTDTVHDGEVQWMTSGSGIMHEEHLPSKDGMLGVQLWLNMPAKDKMAPPDYHAIKNDEIEEIALEGGKLRLLAGQYLDHQGHMGTYVPLNYYDIHLDAHASLTIPTPQEDNVILFTLKGDAFIHDEAVSEKTAVRTTQGDHLVVRGAEGGTQILFMSAPSLKEPVAWGGPIVMNTRSELLHAFDELRDGTFIKDTLEI